MTPWRSNVTVPTFGPRPRPCPVTIPEWLDHQRCNGQRYVQAAVNSYTRAYTNINACKVANILLTFCTTVRRSKSFAYKQTKSAYRWSQVVELLAKHKQSIVHSTTTTARHRLILALTSTLTSADDCATTDIKLTVSIGPAPSLSSPSCQGLALRATGLTPVRAIQKWLDSLSAIASCSAMQRSEFAPVTTDSKTYLVVVNENEMIPYSVVAN